MLALVDPLVEPVQQPLPCPLGVVLVGRAPRPGATSASISSDDEVALLLDPARALLGRQPVRARPPAAPGRR